MNRIDILVYILTWVSSSRCIEDESPLQRLRGSRDCEINGDQLGACRGQAEEEKHGE